MLTSARREVIIANAYFFPATACCMRCAMPRGGVRVKLIVQGEPDIPIVKVGARLLYHYLVKGGVQITNIAVARCMAKSLWRTTTGPPSGRATWIRLACR
jgi:phosphatidylserine/phosphatidylglycerophosphate/cardiolipin synthase-like enzyme